MLWWWGGGHHLIALLSGCREVGAILTMKAKQNNKLFSFLAGELAMTDIKTSPIQVMDLAGPRVAKLGPSTSLCHPITLF